MTTPTHPLTPSENAEINAALQAACAELDAQRLKSIDFFSRMVASHKRWERNSNDYDVKAHNNEEANAYHLAARTLAQQMAERL